MSVACGVYEADGELHEANDTYKAADRRAPEAGTALHDDGGTHQKGLRRSGAPRCNPREGAAICILVAAVVANAAVAVKCLGC